MATCTRLAGVGHCITVYVLSVSRKSNHHQPTYSAAVHVISISATTASKGSIVVYRCLAALAADPKGARRGHAQAFAAQAPAAAGSLAEGDILV